MEYELINKQLKILIGTIGAELKSIQHDGVEYLWQGNPEIWDRTAPILFPITGGWENDQYYLNDKVYNMQKHGFSKTMDFSVVSKSPDSLILQLTSNKETYKQYPFSFNLTVKFRIIENSIQTMFIIENLSDNSLPFALGSHPSFNWPFEEKEHEEDYRLIFNKQENIHAHSTDGTTRSFLNNESAFELKRQSFSNGAICLPRIASDCVELKGSKRQIRIHKNNFNSLILWTTLSDSANFLCIEPVTGFREPGSSFLDHNGIILLKGHDSCSYSYQIEIIR